MGIIINQSLKNTIYTYLGFAIGAVNTLFLYTNFLTDEYYGLVGYILSAANIMTPILAFGVQNTLIKFYSSYTDQNEQAKFTALMFFLPLLMIVPVGVIGVFGYGLIVSFLSKENVIIKDYVWIIYIVAIAMAYFEVFFAWTKAQMRSVFGNFLKEVFHRVVVMVLLFAVYLKWLTAHEFIIASMFMYILRTFLMAFSAYMVQRPTFNFCLPSNAKDILKYSSLIILAGSVAIILLDVDKFMIGQFKAIENVAFYNVAVFIAMVIVVPSRAMHQITYPLTAKLMNENNKMALKDLYKRSSLNLYLIGGFIFLLIVLNINELYKVIPGQYSGGITVVFIIALAKLSECLLGNNNAILFNSNYYRMVLFFGVFLAVLTVFLNIIFIPRWGINGAAFATLLAFLTYSWVKIWFVGKKFKMHPFSKETISTTVVILVFFGVFYFWDFTFHPILNIAFKSSFIGLAYLVSVMKLNLSDDIKNLVLGIIKKRNP